MNVYENNKVNTKSYTKHTSSINYRNKKQRTDDDR